LSEFVASGSPKSVSQRIEECARASGNVTALVVPWESSADRLNMAVTLVKADGWAIEHTNLGTITLTPDGASTRVEVVEQLADRDDSAKLFVVFQRFTADLRRRLGTE
jgi:hypothetical protein